MLSNQTVNREWTQWKLQKRLSFKYFPIQDTIELARTSFGDKQTFVCESQ